MANNLVVRCDLRHNHALSPPAARCDFPHNRLLRPGPGVSAAFASVPGAIAGPPGPLWCEPAATVVRSRSRR